MAALLGYGFVAIITTLVLSPIIKFGRGVAVYICVFGIVYAVVLLFAPTSYFEPSWAKYLGYFISFVSVALFTVNVWKKMKKQKELLDIVEEQEK